mmetsp:Transcript_4993/g.11398  ORF Transcript_4993/g.11398 Transcript_4993/m.11398 type:complete len:303 (-) Transcript_4993:131-1039(-)
MHCRLVLHKLELVPGVEDRQQGHLPIQCYLPAPPAAAHLRPPLLPTLAGVVLQHAQQDCQAGGRVVRVGVDEPHSVHHGQVLAGGGAFVVARGAQQSHAVVSHHPQCRSGGLVAHQLAGQQGLVLARMQECPEVLGLLQTQQHVVLALQSSELHRHVPHHLLEHRIGEPAPLCDGVSVGGVHVFSREVLHAQHIHSVLDILQSQVAIVVRVEQAEAADQQTLLLERELPPRQACLLPPLFRLLGGLPLHHRHHVLQTPQRALGRPLLAVVVARHPKELREGQGVPLARLRLEESELGQRVEA